MFDIKLRPVSYIALLIFFVVGCGYSAAEFGAGQKVIGDEFLTTDSKMTPEDLARVGEQIITPATLTLAIDIFKMSLRKDPNNVKAQFYLTLLNRSLLFKGIGSRATPLMEQNGNVTAWQRSFENIKDSRLKQFLLNGPKDLASAFDVQNLIADYRNSMASLYSLLKQNQTATLTVFLDDRILDPAALIGGDNDCTVLEGTLEKGLKIKCPSRKWKARKLNMTDLIALRMAVASEIVSLIPLTTYSVEGVEPLKDLITKGQSLDHKLSLARTQSAFGNLRRDNGLSFMETLGSDYSIVMSHYKEQQASRCPLGNQASASGKTQRPGYLFENGFCTNAQQDSESFRLAELINGAFRGSIEINLQRQDQVAQSTVVRPLALTLRPPPNLFDVLESGATPCSYAPTNFVREVLPQDSVDQFVDRCQLDQQIQKM